jgi:adenylate cyclase
MADKIHSEIVTILIADICGYTKTTSKMGRSEFDFFHEVFDRLSVPIFSRYSGNIIKKVGDAYFVTFKSATDSILCGIELQNAFFNYNNNFKPEHPINIRVVLHAGEVIFRHGDIYGDAVNTAARIESIAKPNHIVFSGTVFLAMNKNEVPFRQIGVKRFRGVEYPVKLFRVVGEYDQLMRRKKIRSMIIGHAVRRIIFWIIFFGMLAAAVYFGSRYI